MSQKILVVDDEPATRKLVESLLTTNGYNVVLAEDGLEALSKIQQEDPALIVLDIMMPEINGYDVCYQLRFNDNYEKIPIVLLTKRDQEIDDSIGQRINIEYAPKPIDSDSLLEKIKTLLSK